MDNEAADVGQFELAIGQPHGQSTTDEGRGSRFRLRAKRVAEIAALHADVVDREGRFPQEAVDAMRAEGLLGMQIPRSLGGDGASLWDLANVSVMLGGACASSAMIFAMHQTKTASLVSHAIDAPWHRGLMRRISSEQLLIASSTTEKGIGGDLRHSICGLVCNNQTFRLEKDAPVISYGAEADLILATCRRSEDATSSDQVLVALEKDSYTLTRYHAWDAMGMRGTRSDGFKLSATGDLQQVLPKPFSEIAAQSMLATSHLLWSSVWLGMAWQAISKVHQSLLQLARRDSGSIPFGSDRLSDAKRSYQTMKAEIEWALALTADNRGSSPAHAAAFNNLKISCSERLLSIINDSIMAIGISAFQNGGELSLSRILRDAQSAQLMISNDRIRGNLMGLTLLSKAKGHLDHLELEA